jgi:hypothetical protein
MESTPEMTVRRQCLETGVVHGTADREMVETLDQGVLQTDQFVHCIIEETPDSGPSDAGRFGFKVKSLTDQPAFPVQMPIDPGSFRQRRVELSKHAKADGAVCRDVLMTRNVACSALAVRAHQQIKRQM